MVSIICKDGEFLVKGSFFMGNAGIFENKEYGEGNITIQCDIEDIVLDLEGDYFWMKPLKPLLENVPKEGDAIAKVYEDYLNAMEEKVKKNAKQVNDYFWYQLISHLNDCGYPFWEVEEAILPKYRGCTEEEYEKVYGNEELMAALPKLYKEFDEISNDGSMEKTDVEAMLKRVMPMFDFDGLVASIESDCLNIEGGMLQVQFSDGWDRVFYCAACVEFDDTLTPRDWDNF